MIFGAPGTAADDDIDLPPMDGGSDESASDETDSDDLDPVPADAGNDPFDDSTGTDDPVDSEEIDPLDEDSLVAGGDREQADDLEEDAEFLEDRGSDPALESESMLADNDGLGVGDEDFGLGDEAPLGAMDGGEEGPGEADEELREEDLPALDADDLGDADDSDFFDLDASAPPPFPWAEPRWEARTVASIGAVMAVVPVGAPTGEPLGDGALAMGVDPAQLWRIEQARAELLVAEGAPREGWRRLRAPRKTAEIWLETDAGTFVSRDGGRRFEHRPDPLSTPVASTTLAEIQRELTARGVDLQRFQVSAAVIVDEAGTLLTALRRPGESTAGTWLVRIPSLATASRTVGAVRGVVWDLAWDDLTGRAWVASDDGVTILAPRA